MAVISVFGATEMGKSFYVNEKLLSTYSRSIVLDPHSSFKGTHYLENPSDDDFEKMFIKTASLNSFKIIIRPGRRSNIERIFRKAVVFSSALGRKSLQKGERLIFAIDEASVICSPHNKSDELAFLVTQGRHDGVDSVFISQDPMDIHPSIRRNSTKIISFFVHGASGMDFFTKSFGRELAKKVENFDKYHFITREGNGYIFITNEKGNIYAKFNEK